jgi:osmoprotectant transport system permease protein
VAPGDPLIRWDWVASHLDELAFRLAEHALFTVVAVGIGFALSFALAIAALRQPRVSAVITGIAGTLYTIPSLALFALLIPVTGLSFLTAEIALVSYTILILFRAIVSGVASVPPEVRQAADGLGFSRWQRLWRVELPVALPVIVGGLRLATVTTIGLVTVTALIGQGGLGRLIVDGYQRFFATPLVVGAVLSVALAFAADAAFLGAQRALTPWSRGTAVEAAASARPGAR